MTAFTDTTDTTFKTVFETEGGGQIRFYVLHGRIDVTTQSPNGRHRNTTTAKVDRIRHLARRLNELCDFAEASQKERA
ncbi:hypothetical protein MKK88_05920 [Methylobacterium sp. E-005]|uniref:hypothetical protein n=1 Tax=Methylobacterium sp. E-005 TaxID=2836549 RepID=UPI001FBBE43F|nr:hypothetical protein [Methylobacterium sp. E-005]MCJ2085532.1 hypothetical protein [Methylobacterium sp. E-005]